MQKTIYIYIYILILLCTIIGNIIFLPTLYEEYESYNFQINKWKLNQIKNSERVCYTRTGTKYHRCYHYSGRNYETSTFEAVTERNLDPCSVCNPEYPNFDSMPTKKHPYFPNPYKFAFASFLIIIISRYSLQINKKTN